MKWRLLFLYGGYKTDAIIGTAGSAKAIENRYAEGTNKADEKAIEKATCAISRPTPYFCR